MCPHLNIQLFDFYMTVDAGNPNFKPLAAVVKEEKETTKQTLQKLLPLQ